MFKIKHLIHNGKDFVFGENMGKRFRPFGTDNNVVCIYPARTPLRVECVSVLWE